MSQISTGTEKQALIIALNKLLEQLPEQQVKEVKNFAEYLEFKTEDMLLQRGIETLAITSGSFDFLNDEEDLYDDSDCIEIYNHDAKK